MIGLVISCAGDLEFAKEVYDLLYAGMGGQKPSEQGKQRVQIDKELISLAEDEIHIDSKSQVPIDAVKGMLESLLKSNPERFKDYSVIEFGDTLTVGKILHPSQMEMLTCEICGFFTPHSAELYTHRMTHFGI